MKISVVIAGGGSGKRMQSHENKLFIEIGGTAILAMTTAVFESTEIVDEIIITVPADEIERTKALMRQHSFKKVAHVVAGGHTRQASVFNGLQKISTDTNIVVIHDGARPFVTKEIIITAVNEIKICKAVVVGMPVKDTIKAVNEGGFVTNTLDRNLLWQAQTPQVFDAALIKKAHSRAQKIGLTATDDSHLVERLGESVKMIQGSYKNIKITTPDDIKTAEAILLSKKH
ncbi:MAG: 2-C-methyl-D-erythritol 4-phosphate cytidylyltransferase [Candidatus Margulisiibacteriota bacterium]